MSNQTQAEKILAGVRHEDMNQQYRLQKAQALATLALADAVKGAAEPKVVEVKVDPRDGVSFSKKAGPAHERIKYVYALKRLLPDEKIWETMELYTDKAEADEEAAALNSSYQGIKWDVEPLTLRGPEESD